ncbi:MAG TPA: heterodisulfide reductase-related iron-sulfur binding cluster, partial [Bacillota bacterium]|nr:heterodisulfide reductase-related iron-sulfur binding cluster [Bacillota bacterium]
VTRLLPKVMRRPLPESDGSSSLLIISDPAAITPDIKQMVKMAREILRKEYFRAGMGISGANIGVAETGSVILVTNEGNDRLVTTIPPVHVVIMGYEKLVPTMADVGPILEALPRSATAQKITSYISVLTGATPAVDVQGNPIEKEIHIILLDNGRLQMAKDPVMGQAWQCIRCASCLNVCPVYQMVGGHVYGDIYAGGIGVILTSFVNSDKEADKLQELCIACGRCKEVCPGKVPVTDLIVELRDRLTEKRELPGIPKFIFDKVMSNRKVFHSMLRLAALGQKPLTLGAPTMRHLPLFGLTEFRSLPAIATKPFRDLIKNYEQRVPANAPQIQFFIGCATDFAYPGIGMAALKVLNHLGYRVNLAREQSCCGTPARYMGDLKTARKLAKENIAAMEAFGDQPIVGVCPTCIGSLAHDYVDLFEDEPQWAERARKISQQVIEFTRFLSLLPEEQRQLLPFGQGEPNSLKVTYHDSCHLKRNLGISEEPRQLLRSIPGYEFTEMAYPDRCCGCGGSFSLKFPELSAPILAKKLETVQETGADVLAVACPGCLMQLKGGLDKQGSAVKVKHVAELVAEALAGNG